MELREYLDILRRRWISAVLVALIVLAVTAVATLLTPNRYTATTRLFFAVQGTESVTDLAQGSTFAEKQITSYAQVATSPLVLDRVIEQLNLDVSADELAESIRATVPTDTVILDVFVVDLSPEKAAAIANAVGTELAKVVSQLSPERDGGAQTVKATILKPAVVPIDPSSPRVLRNLALGAILAIILGVAAALLRNVLDTKIRSDDDVRRVTAVPLLGSIAFDERLTSNVAVVAADPLSASSESVRRLRTNIQFIGSTTTCKQIVVTSSVPGEGKTTTSINLAVSLADAGLRVLLVDADLRRPTVADYLGLEGAAGLTTVLIGRAEPSDVIQPWGASGLDVLPSGQVPPNPSELLGSNAMTLLLKQLGETYDVVLLDSAPLLPVTDATILTRLTGGALVIVGADRIHRRQLNEALNTLTTASACAYGLVLNKVAKREAQPYAYRAGYYRASVDSVSTPARPDRSRQHVETPTGDESPAAAAQQDRTEESFRVGATQRPG